jgi:hypothetical protein
MKNAMTAPAPVSGAEAAMACMFRSELQGFSPGLDLSHQVRAELGIAERPD